MKVTYVLSIIISFIFFDFNIIDTAVYTVCLLPLNFFSILNASILFFGFTIIVLLKKIIVSAPMISDSGYKFATFAAFNCAIFLHALNGFI